MSIVSRHIKRLMRSAPSSEAHELRLRLSEGQPQLLYDLLGRALRNRFHAVVSIYASDGINVFYDPYGAHLESRCLPFVSSLQADVKDGLSKKSPSCFMRSQKIFKETTCQTKMMPKKTS